MSTEETSQQPRTLSERTQVRGLMGREKGTPTLPHDRSVPTASRFLPSARRSEMAQDPLVCHQINSQLFKGRKATLGVKHGIKKMREIKNTG